MYVHCKVLKSSVATNPLTDLHILLTLSIQKSSVSIADFSRDFTLDRRWQFAHLIHITRFAVLKIPVRRLFCVCMQVSQSAKSDNSKRAEASTIVTPPSKKLRFDSITVSQSNAIKKYVNLSLILSAYIDVHQ